MGKQGAIKMTKQNSTLQHKKAYISPERRERFKWDNGDLKFFKNKEELEQHAKENNEKIVWYK